MNKATEEIVGYSREELIGTDFTDYFVQPEKAQKGYQQVLYTGFVRDYPLEIRHRDGHVTPVLYNASVYKDQSGRIIGVFAAARDVTERRNFEKELLESEERYRSLFECSPDAIFLADPETGRILDVNPAACQLLARPRREIIGMHQTQLHPTNLGSQCRQHFAKQVRDSAASGNAHSLDSVVVRPDGTEIPTEIRSQLITLNGRKVFQGVFRDITERKLAEAIVKESEEKFRLLAENGSDTVWTMKMDGTFTYISPAVARLRGYTSEEAVRIPLDQTMTPATLEHVRKLFAEEEKKPESERWSDRILELEQIRKDGSAVWTEVSIRAIRNADGNVIGLQGSTRDISIRKQALDALRKSEERYRAVVEDQTEVICRFKADGTFTFVNDLYCRFFGKSRDELLGTSWQPVVVPEHLPEVERKLAELSVTNPVAVVENCVNSGDGRIHWMQFVNRGFFDEQGQLIEIQSVGRDITERKRAEEALQDSERRYRLLYETMRDAFVHTDMDGRILDSNTAYQTMLGYTPDELATMRYVDLTPSRWHEIEDGIVKQQIIPRGYSDVYEKEYRRKDGTVYPVELRTFLLHDTSGQPCGMWAIVRDVTSRKLMEEELRATSIYARSLIEASLDPLVTISIEGKITDVNQATELVTGVPRTELIGSDFSDYCTEPELARQGYQQVISQGFLMDYALTIRHRSGSTTDVLYNATVHRDELGQVLGVFASARDITERKRAERDREELASQLAQAQKMESIGRLAGGVAHDFNNILTAILGHAELALVDMASDNPIREEIENIHDSAERAATLTQQLLAFARRQVIQPKLLNVNELLGNLTKMLKRMIGEDIELITRTGSDVGGIIADTSQFEQVLLNLAVNARDAMPEGGTLTIATDNLTVSEPTPEQHDSLPPGEFVIVSISDTGMGIPEEIRQHLFEPFFTTKELGKGTGLGLAVVLGIVQSHKGYVRVESSVGQGACFRLYFPRVSGAEGKSAETNADCSYSTGSETILVVEDDNTVRTLICSTLQRAGYTVLSAGSPDECFGLISERGKDVNLLVTDIIMPSLNGRQLYDKLAANFPGLRVLFISGYSGEAVSNHGILDGNLQFLQKPFSISGLLRKVREVLDSPFSPADSQSSMSQ